MLPDDRASKPDDRTTGVPACARNIRQIGRAAPWRRAA